ncbi:hypothetical protein H7J07_16230 [Mycobacterium koreense]|uniref:Uncharacterized protein n=1 Tax=Mycolicibacillus koreensis TaxID=1069220 RepID=A0A7I7SA65_9MYCO|nr:hypothetical protein [Mycolicibacillus koreensis]MCV7249751.1 hypothetical protein [Mycolicibacillus koreensis]ODR08812.1 hypothetical protein BHQ15_08035 [Mycolicibacillus koreensis]OSC32654.1 hypothetical protein B8W67_14710 [Mycolicibacillus koreensis]BBY52885.1 hypothetical protein MKOR_01360 [Mycolicibacillus koreensis]
MRYPASIAAAVAALALTVTPEAGADPPPDLPDIGAYPIAEGHFSSEAPEDFYWKFFRTPDGRHCGIGPNGGPVGCDAVPYDAPAGTNQTIVASYQAAEYRHSDTARFTRDVDVLPEGHRLENWGASCAVGYQGAVTCQTYGEHGFVLSNAYGVLW